MVSILEEGQNSSSYKFSFTVISVGEIYLEILMNVRVPDIRD